jgi:hypothetical protein
MRIRPLLPLCAILLLTTGCVIENAPSDSIVIIEDDNIEENSDEADEGLGDSSTCHVDGLKQGDESAFVFNIESAAEYTHPIAEALPAPNADNNNEICTVNALPVYGAIDLTQSSRQLLSQSLEGFQGEDFDITVLENQYGFFAYPAALGKASFYDRDFINARGGWHGATWTPYNATTEEFSVMDPIVAEVGGTFWYLYRTDFPSFGDRTHAVRFENSSLMMGAEVACDVSGMSFVDYQQLEIDIQGDALAPMPPETSGDIEGVCTFTAMPRVGGALENISLASDILELDESSIEGTKWFIYRTDFSGLTDAQFSVAFENDNLQVGDSVGCDLAESPHVSTGSVEEGVWTINTTYFYLIGSDSPDLNRFNAEGLYDMYFYSSDGADHGPISIIVEDGEVTNDTFDTSLM